MGGQIINAEANFTALMGREGMRKFAGAAYQAIEASFTEAKMLNPTRDEVRRRFEICVKWAKVMRGDLKWGLDRICDTLADALKSELSGQDYKPNHRACWMPGDGA